MAPNITASYFKTLFDEYKGVADPKLEAYIDVASLRVPSTVWGASTRYATALLVAHMLATSGPQGGGPAGGALVSEDIGDASRGYEGITSEPGSGDAVLMTTRYGIDFVALRKETIVPAMTTGRGIRPGSW
jgi:hypothetical protein